MKNKRLAIIVILLGAVFISAFQNIIADNRNQMSSFGPYSDPTTGMEFLPVKRGCFEMGNSFESGDRDEKPNHKVCLDDYYIGKHEVTVGEFRKFVEETGYRTEAERGQGCFGLDKDGNWGVITDKSWNRLVFVQGDNHPVVCVTWNDAQAFIKWLNKKSGGGFRLLSEAEWEFAARSRGKERMYATRTGVLTRKLANYGAQECCNPSDTDGHLYTAPVGSYPANDIGVFDMSGNVWEWTADWYDENYYAYSRQSNPRGPEGGSRKVIRGGSWSIPGVFSRCSNRRPAKPSGRHVNTGFRLAKDGSPGKRLQPDSLDGLPLGDALLVPVGRSFLGQSEVEIRINDRLFSYDRKYDGFGGYWAIIPTDELGEISELKIRYIRHRNSPTTFRLGRETAADWTSPSYFIDSTNEAILEKARQLHSESKTIDENAEMISDFVTGYLKFNQGFHKAPASLKASQTFFQREGVCINYARLFIALCRANGIPARSISGVVLNRDNADQYDFHHEWAEYMDEDGTWHPLDLTYSETMKLSDIRYTDLVYAAEDHAYFQGITNRSLKAGAPIVLQNSDIILFHYHPVFRGAKYGFRLIEDRRPDYFVIEKSVKVIKKGSRVIIKQVF